MMSARLLINLVLNVLFSSGAWAAAPVISFHGAGGDAWTFEKRVEGHFDVSRCDEVHVRSPRESTQARLSGSAFEATVALLAGENVVHAHCLRAGREVARSDPQRWMARLPDTPTARVRVVPGGRTLRLDAGATTRAPGTAAPVVSYRWSARAGNPAVLTPTRSAKCRDLSCEKTVELALPAADGEYFVTLDISDASGASDRSVTMFEVRSGRFQTADLDRDHPAWVDDVVLYGVVPFFFGGFDGVRERLDEIKALGATAIWLSPVTDTTPDDFGYAPTNHFALRATFGDEKSFRRLIDTAHQLGLKVIIDFVPNHFSDRHPYFLDATRHDHRSPYYHWFDRDEEGEVTRYFDWNNLKNLNYDHAEVQSHMLTAFAHWVRAYDVDGFRVDASWAVAQRAPEFWPRLRTELKRIKPDILLLAEASARDAYFVRNGFDAAYDWTDNLGEWAWREVFHDANTVPDLARLRTAITNAPHGFADDTLILRFINNNDTGERFLSRFDLPYTRLASTLLFTLPGIPLIYNGDELGAAFEPYDEGPPFDWRDAHDLSGHYRRLTALRRQHSALRSGEIRLVSTNQDERVLVFERPMPRCDAAVLVLMNFGPQTASVSIRDATIASYSAREWRDLASGAKVHGGRRLKFDVAGYSSRLLQPSGCEPR